MTRTRGGEDGPDEPGTFDFLGFTVHWAKSPMTGKWVVKTRTAGDRFRRTLNRISQRCKVNRHAPLERQQQVLNQKLLRSQRQPGATRRAPQQRTARAGRSLRRDPQGDRGGPPIGVRLQEQAARR
jgi:hypothetical protein